MKEVIVEKKHRYRGKLREPGQRYKAEKAHMQLGKALGWFREAPTVPAPLKAAVVETSPVRAVAAAKPARKTATPRSMTYGTRAMAVQPDKIAEEPAKQVADAQPDQSKDE